MPKLQPLKAQLTVSRKMFLTPHYIRVFLTGDVCKFNETTVGNNNKILIPPPGVNAVHFPEIDPVTKQKKSLPAAISPTIRTYTHRGIDLERGEMWIDFVYHGDGGIASSWAAKAEKGDLLGVMMKKGTKQLYPSANYYLLVGDATAIPVLAAILQDLPAEATGTCIIEVHDKDDEQQLPTDASIELIWQHNPTPHKGSALADTVRSQNLPEIDRFAYVAAEFDTVKSIRNFLRKESGWQREELYAYSYWKAGKAENNSQRERRQELQSE